MSAPGSNGSPNGCVRSRPRARSASAVVYSGRAGSWRLDRRVLAKRASSSWMCAASGRRMRHSSSVPGVHQMEPRSGVHRCPHRSHGHVGQLFCSRTATAARQDCPVAAVDALSTNDAMRAARPNGFMIVLLGSASISPGNGERYRSEAPRGRGLRPDYDRP